MRRLPRFLLPIAVVFGLLLSAWPATAAQPVSVLRQSVPKVMGSRNGGPVTTLGSAAAIGDRLAVTAYHVIGDAQNIYLLFLDGTTVPVRPVLAEPAADLAVLRADRSLPAAPFAIRDGSVRLGDAQTVVGYRQDLAEQPSVKYGKVTGLVTPGAPGPDGREWPLVSSDTAASFGDSGGPVLDSDSRLTGIVRGGITTGGTPSLLSTPAGAISAYLARGWVLDRSGNPVASQTSQPGVSYQPYPYAAQSPWWRW
ncbi:MAG: serine protease [Dehalococcoidia bacterium]